MKYIRTVIQPFTAMLVAALPLGAQMSPAGLAPSNFGNVILTSTPANATGPSGVSTVFTSSGTEFTFGTGGALIDPSRFEYAVTGPDTATITYPPSEGGSGSTTNLVFTGPSTGTYTTMAGEETTTGSFNLAAIPSSAPIANVSTRTTVAAGASSTVGFVIAGTMPRRVLVRAVGPGLVPFGVTNAMPNPLLSLYQSTQLLARNDDWGTAITATGGPGTTPTVSLGTSTGSTTSGSATTGSTPTEPATTTGITTGGTTTAGTSTGSSTTETVDSRTPIEGSDPTAGSGTQTSTTSSGVVTGTLATGSTFTAELATARNFTTTGAFALTVGSGDAAFVATLPPGAYTVQVTPSSAAGAATVATTSAAGLISDDRTGMGGRASAGATTGDQESAVLGGTRPGTNPAFGSAITPDPTAATATIGPVAAGGTDGASGTMGQGASTGLVAEAPTGVAESKGGEVLVEVYFIE